MLSNIVMDLWAKYPAIKTFYLAVSLLCIGEKCVAKRSAVFVFNETTLVLFTIYRILSQIWKCIWPCKKGNI